MKKTVLAFVTFVCLSTAVNAQKGSILLYGNVGFTTNSVTNSTPDIKGNFSINPGIGYQFNNAWTVGVEGNYNYQDASSEIIKQYSAGAFLRYSEHIAGIFSAYAQLGLGWQGASENDGIAVNKLSGFYANVTPTIYADVKNGFGLNFSVGGLSYSSLGSNGITASSFGLTFGKGATFGLSKNFGGSKKK